jgi:hypothetical protein
MWVMAYTLWHQTVETPAMDNETKIDPEGIPGGKMRTPPYVSWRTFLTLLSEFKTNGLPPQVDRSVLKRFAGGMQGQLLLALRSLDLIDAENKPKPKLKGIVDAYETDAFQGEMRTIMSATYPYVFRLDLMSATPTMFADAFKDNTDAKEDVLRKCRTFFLHAAKELGIPLGPRIEKATFPRAKSNGVKRTKPKGKPDEAGGVGDTGNATPPGNNPNNGQATVVEKLLGKFPDFDPAWPDEIKKQWFEGFQRFMDGAGVNKKGDAS